MKNKLKDNKGFSLSEALVTTIIVVLLSAILVALCRLANTSFVKLTRDAQGQILCSTLRESIENELRYADNITLIEEKTENQGEQKEETLPYNYTFFSRESGLGKGCVLKAVTNKNGKDVLAVVQPDADDPKDDVIFYLISDGSYSFDLEAKVDSTYTGSLFNVTITIFYGEEENVVKTQTFAVIPANK